MPVADPSRAVCLWQTFEGNEEAMRTEKSSPARELAQLQMAKPKPDVNLLRKNVASTVSDAKGAQERTAQNKLQKIRVSKYKKMAKIMDTLNSNLRRWGVARCGKKSQAHGQRPGGRLHGSH